mgnify:CR=1 FL=1
MHLIFFVFVPIIFLYLKMEHFKIIFSKEPYNKEDSFVNGTESFLISATITKSTNGVEDIYQVKLNDIGLDSLYGEFVIVKKNGFWQSTDKDDLKFNLLKWNITRRLEEINK